MSVKVLRKSEEITNARSEMRRRELDCVTPWFQRLLNRTGISDGVNVGDPRKSWDVLMSLRFIEEKVDKFSAILDLGAYASELLCSLHRMGYSNLTGIDLNPKLERMPYRRFIRYTTGDFTETEFPSETFEVVTAISVLEHGFCGPKVFAEVSRILKPGGYFLGSVDYWPNKIDTRGITAFSLDWRIFSKGELVDLIEEAEKHGLVPVGHPDFEALETTARWLKKNYTFAWFAFQKPASLQ